MAVTLETPQPGEPGPPAAPTRALPPALAWVCLAFLAAVFALLADSSAARKSVTIDEFAHLPAGCNVLRSGDLRYCQYNPPLVNALTALPVVLAGVRLEPPPGVSDELRYGFWPNGYLFMDQNRERYVDHFRSARRVTILLGVLVGVVAFLWARVLVPERRDLAGLLAAGWIWADPNFLAHARVVTTDVGFTLFFLLSLFTLFLFLRRASLPRALLAGAALGLAQLTKLTAILLVPSHLAVIAVLVACGRVDGRKRTLLLTPLLFAVALLVLNAGYLFQGSGWPPLPEEYLAALERQLADVEAGDPSFLFGEAYHGGRWYYFLALCAIKLPLPALLLVLFAAVRFCARRGASRFESLQLLLPGLAVFAAFSFLSDKQIGIRMILPALAVAWLWAACNLARGSWGSVLSGVVPVLLCWFALETWQVHPHYTPYFNQTVGGPAHGYRQAIGSNLDWGQDLPALKEYMDRNGLERVHLLYYGRVDPALYGIEYDVPLSADWSGTLAVSRSLYGKGYALHDHGRLVPVPRVNPSSLGAELVATLGHTIDVYRRRR